MNGSSAQGRPGVPAYPGNAAAVTKSDTTVFNASHIYVGTAGTVTVVTEKGQTVAFKVPAGGVVPVVCVQVLSTGTDAADMVRVYD